MASESFRKLHLVNGKTVAALVIHLLAALVLFIGATHAAFASAGADEVRIEAYVAALAERTDAEVVDVLRSVNGTHRRLLALRAYLRAGPNRNARWSWTAAQIETYERSGEYRDMMSAVATVRAEFEKQNPGFSLYANTQVRSLGVQLERWNNNRTVGVVADSLLQQTRTHFRAANYPAVPDATSLEKFAGFLSQWTPSTAVPLAAPGMSLHGQARAIDFQIKQDQRIIASTDTSSIKKAWDGPGWTEKLRNAVEVSGAKFSGPLRSPREPWHYEYGAGTR